MKQNEMNATEGSCWRLYPNEGKLVIEIFGSHLGKDEDLAELNSEQFKAALVDALLKIDARKEACHANN